MQDFIEKHLLGIIAAIWGIASPILSAYYTQKIERKKSKEEREQEKLKTSNLRNDLEESRSKIQKLEQENLEHLTEQNNKLFEKITKLQEGMIELQSNYLSLKAQYANLELKYNRHDLTLKKMQKEKEDIEIERLRLLNENKQLKLDLLNND